MRKVHISYAVTVMTVGIVVGVVLAFNMDMRTFGAGVWVFVAVGLVAMAMWQSRFAVMVLAVLGGVILGAWRTNLSVGEADLIRSLEGVEVRLSGRVFDDPEVGETGMMILRMHDLEVEGRQVRANLFVTVRKEQDVRRGDRVTMEARMGAGFGSYAGSMWRVNLEQIERVGAGDLMGRVRDVFATNVREYVREPEVDLALSYLLGQRRALSEEMVDLLRVTGLTHVVVASGFHLMVLVGVVRKLFEKVSRVLTVWMSGAMILGFVAIAGAGPSMVRAAITAGTVLAMWYLGRKFQAEKLLVLIAAVTLMLEPSYVVDVGWQLSFAALVGVMILAPAVMRWLWGEKKIGVLKSVAVISLTTSVTTLPILMFYFGRVSVVSLVTNILVLPAVPWMMLGSFLTGFFALFAPFVAGFFGFLTEWMLRVNLWVMEYFGSFEWAEREVSVGMVGVVVIYVAIGGLIWFLKWRNKRDLAMEVSGGV